MGAIASQITSLTIVYSIVYSDADQRKHQSSASLAFVWGIHRDRWIPRTNGQLRRKCFHLMTSSCSIDVDNGSTPNRWQVITWTMHVVCRRFHASPGINELRISLATYVNAIADDAFAPCTYLDPWEQTAMNLLSKTIIFIEENALENVVPSKVAVILFRPQCVNLKVLRRAFERGGRSYCSVQLKLTAPHFRSIKSMFN